MGDSGNAEGTGPHLHFEIRQPPPPGGYTGTPINAYESLRLATVWSATSVWELRRTATAGTRRRTDQLRRPTRRPSLLCDWDGDGADEAVIYRSRHLAPPRRRPTAGPRPARSRSAPRSDTTALRRRRRRRPRRAGAVPGRHVDGSGRVRRRRRPSPGRARYGVQAGDQPVLGDWDGDGDDDLAIHRAGTWHVRSTGTAVGGTVSDVHVRAAARRPARRRRLGRRRRRRRRHLPQRASGTCARAADVQGGTVTLLRLRRPDGAAARGPRLRPRHAGHRHLPPPHRLTPRYRRRRSLAMWVIWISSVPA